MAISKVVYGQSVLMDLTSDTVDAAHLASGYTAHDAGGNLIIGALEPQGSDNLLSGVTPSLLNGTTQSGKTYVVPAGDVGGTNYIEYQLDIPELESDVTYGVFVYGNTENNYRSLTTELYYRETNGIVRYKQASSVFFNVTPSSKAINIELASGVKPTKIVLSFSNSSYSLSISNVMLFAIDV